MRQLLCGLLLASVLTGCASSPTTKANKDQPTIIHSVFFTLKHEAGSVEETSFFTKAEKLIPIPGVQNFKVLQEVSTKNPYDYGFYMEFATQSDYDRYNIHPDHVQFVEEVWMQEVVEFQEIDYIEGLRVE